MRRCMKGRALQMIREERLIEILAAVSLAALAILYTFASGAQDVAIPHVSTGGVLESGGIAGPEFSLTPEQDDYCVGQPMWLTYGILNATSSTVDLGGFMLEGVGTDFSGDWPPFQIQFRMYDVSVRESSGALVPSHLTKSWGASLAGGRLKLEPREVFSQRLLLQRWVRIEKPGTYEVSVALRARPGNDRVRFPEVVAKLTVIPKDPVRIRAEIDDLVARLDPAFPAEEKYDAFNEAPEPATPVPFPPVDGFRRGSYDEEIRRPGVLRETVRQEIRAFEVCTAVWEAEALLYQETIPALRHLLESRHERMDPASREDFPPVYEVERAINAIEKATS